MGGTPIPLLALVACIFLCCRIVVVVVSSEPNGRPPVPDDEITLDRQQIFVRFERFTIFNLMIDLDGSLQDLREDIKAYERVHYDFSLLLGNTRLDYDLKLSAQNIKTGATVTLVLDGDRGHQTISFTVKTRDGRQVPIVTYLDNTIANIKDIITHESGIPQAEQRLLLEGKELKDERKLTLYRIYNQTTIELAGPFEDCRGRLVTISVKTLSGATIEVQADLAETVNELKEKIGQKTGIPVGVQRLFLDDRAIIGEDHLCDLGLEDGFTLYMFLYSSRIKSLDQVARLHEEPSQVSPNQGPIFREVDKSGARSYFKDARNWIVRSIPSPGSTLSMFDPVAYWTPNPDDETQMRNYRQLLERLSSVDASESDRLRASGVGAQIKLSSAVGPYRTEANLTSAKHVRQHSGFTLGGGSTYVNPNRQVPLGADINNWAPDAFSDTEVLRLFEMGERVRRVLASGEGILSIASQRHINSAILNAYLEALAGYPLAVGYDQPSEGEQCGICLDELQVEPAAMLACHHAFHTDCILTWATNLYRDRQNPSCPLCRQRFRLPYEAQDFEQDNQGDQ